MAPDFVDWVDQPRSPGRRRRWLMIVAIAVVALIAARTAISYWVQNLWFDSLGYGEVFRKTLSLQWTLFLIFFAATFLLLYGWFLALKRAYRTDLLTDRPIYFGRRPINVQIDRAFHIAAIVILFVIAVATAASMMGEWATFALDWYAPRNSHITDPIFGRSLDFYLFSLPVWQLVTDWLFTIALISCGIAILFVFITGSARVLSGRRNMSVPLPWRGFSIAFAFLLLVIASRVYLSRFDALFEQHTIFSGVEYVDAHVTLAGLLVVCAALIAGAAIACVNVVSAPKIRWLAMACVPAIACYFGMQLVAWYVGNFIVKPNQLDRERPYITYNIAATQAAYGLDRVSQHEFPAETTVAATDPANNQATLQNIRLWDWHALQDTLRQIQEIRTYYDFPDIDIDRYEIDGSIREMMLAARELSLEKLPEGSRNWINDKLIYTHGYGITMNPVNGFTTEGLPTLILSNMPIQTTVPNISVTRPEIYFGELTNDDVYVKTRQQEFDYPQGQTNAMTAYAGTGGIVLGGFFRRALIALDRGDLTKVPFSDDIQPQSRLLMLRNVRDRAAVLAPFLTFDSDPYIVAGDDGRLFWILDAFTTSDKFPYASAYSLGDASIDYIRNSVKVVVDAYDGTTTFYVFDSQDPVLAGYRGIFPELFKDASSMPPTLRKHVRYPELLLQTQASLYGLYHMTDPEVFYNREDLWTVATEVGMGGSGEQSAHTMDPNFVLMKLPGEKSLEFIDILPFTPSNRNNMIGWIAGRSDGANYGDLLVYDFPKTRLVDGPMQIEARIDQNAQLSGQLTLWNQQGSHVRRGALIVIPCGRALLYAEPIYLQAERSPMPELRLVVLALQDRLVYGPTFESAMQALFGGEASTLNLANAPAEAAPNAAPSAAKPSAADADALIAGAAKDLEDYQRLTAQGKLAEAGQKLEELKRKLDQLNSRHK